MDNRYGSYRQVRAQRTWRTLGKMSWWRIILGTALLLSVFLISGFVSQRLALAGHFRAAEKLMVYPRWVEQYRPDLKAFIDAGALYADGDYEAAREAFEQSIRLHAVLYAPYDSGLDWELAAVRNECMRLCGQLHLVGD